YMEGYDLKKTLEGHGLRTDTGDPEDLDVLYRRMRKALLTDGPIALINRRKMAPGIKGVEGMCKGHDAISPDLGMAYLREKGHEEAAKMIEEVQKIAVVTRHRGSSDVLKKNRAEFGSIIADILEGLSPEEQEKVLVIDNDLEGSTGLKTIRERVPARYIKGGIMERNNYSVAAGFGSGKGRQGIFSTFSAFLEMVVSEITMARLNDANVLAHFSHAGIDEMADNTCHYGINIFFGDNGLEPDRKTKTTRLYFPADAGQMKALLKEIFKDEGLRFVFSTRSATPQILDEDGKPFYDDDYIFKKDKDELIREGEPGDREGRQGYIVTYGEMLYRALDAVEQLKEEGISVGLINKPTLNMMDAEMMEKLKDAPFVLVVETQNRDTGLGIRFGTWLAERGFKGRYAHLGTTKPGEGGLSEHIPYQGLDAAGIMSRVKELTATK
ncbi:MAG: transketolase, partial [DPANN group archaeon]|nr:transketolase [DPANN group archaeon]